MTDDDDYLIGEVTARCGKQSFSRLALLCTCLRTGADDRVLVEAESLDECGGWVVDQQFMDLMGSPYLLAHGLGEPVRDAVSRVKFPAAGEYRVWVRTRDWVAPWKAPGAPGRFQVLIDGQPLDTTFGTEGAKWHWQDGGIVKVGAQANLRCTTSPASKADAMRSCFAAMPSSFRPMTAPHWKHCAPGYSTGRASRMMAAATTWSSSAAGSPERRPRFRRHGSASRLRSSRTGPCSAATAAPRYASGRKGKTNLPPYPHIGDIVSELVRDRTKTDGNAKSRDIYDDERKLRVVRARKEHHAVPRTAREPGGSEGRYDHGRRRPAHAHRPADTARRPAVPRFHWRRRVGRACRRRLRDDRNRPHGRQQPVERRRHDEERISDPVRVQGYRRTLDGVRAIDEAGAVSTLPVGRRSDESAFPGRKGFDKSLNDKNPMYRLGGWFWETGFNKDPIRDVEWMRDQNLRAMYGAWDALKNVDKLYPNHRLKWAAYIAGKRESRRLLGDVVLTADDFRSARTFDDACFPCTWRIDLHSPNPDFVGDSEGEEFISEATEGKSITVPRAVLGSVSLPLQPQHFQSVHGRPRHQRHARRARRRAA